MALSPGTKLGAYEIVAPLGAGGMGEVYRARDTKLGRDVALKMLPAEMARDPERLGRFRREAKALAQLDHPNIVTIHSVEECDGIHFLTMQLVEGLPLDRLIPQGGLPSEQIVEIANALGDALAAAHEKGIVHRDLKPANVMVSNGGRVKVLDFGLAKDIRTADLSDATMTSANRTEVGLVMGTPAYMSPEQASGRPLDHRTDIFSLGVVLHEMATGQRPFEGSSSAELVSAILRDTPPPVTDVRPDLPSDMARVIRRCLEKDPRHRVQTARDVSNEFRDLARQASHKVAPATPSTSRAVAAADSGASRTDEGFWIAVLPFKYSGGNADLTALAEGLTEDIVTGLSRFSYLRVIARNSTAKYSGESGDVRTIGKELGARYVMEGSLRQAGSKLRLAVQLVDATSGAHLWAETYERPFSPDAVFEIQDYLVPRIVSTVADAYGVLPHTMSQEVRNKPVRQLTPYEALLRSFGYAERVTPEEHSDAKAALEQALQKAPGSSDCWAMLSILFSDEHVHGFAGPPDPLGRALQAARRAVDANSGNHKAHQALAWALCHRKEFPASRVAAERTIALNPLDACATVYMGFTIAFSGEWERGSELVTKSIELNPNHPGWYWFVPFLNAYRKDDYRAALELALKINMPGFTYGVVSLAAAYGQLGETESARSAVKELMALRPDYASIACIELGRIVDQKLADHVVDGLRKAGLEIPSQNVRPTSSPAATTGSVHTASGASRTDEGFWIAVLPFKYSGGNADLTALAEGLTEDIVTGLSRFSYLRVIARNSTAKYSSESGDVRKIGKELGARYVMEGSLRQAGSKLRLAVQLVDAVSGAHLWAENYERTFSAESIFALQDDLVPRIVSTVADQNGILTRTMSETLRSKNEDALTPHEAVLRAFSYYQRVTPAEHLVVRRILERAVQEAPDYADCWAMLSVMYSNEFADEFNLGPNPLDRAFAAAQRAVHLAPNHALGHYAQAYVCFFRKETVSFRAAAEKALALNPMDGSVMGMLGVLITHAGESERGCQIVEAAMQINPNYPGLFRFAAFTDAYEKGKYTEALELAVRVHMPNFFYAHAARAAALGQLGHREAADREVRELLALRPDFATAARWEYSKWYDPELVEHMIDGLRKAGLEIPSPDVHPTSSPAARTGGVHTASGASRADEGFWVAVLPFKYGGGNADLTALAEGLTEDIVTGFSRFSYLRVIARNSTAKYSSESGDVRAIGKELGARYVMEGSLRQAGTKLRLAVQLVDAVSGAHLWAENYERTFSPESIFALQDDLVPRIVATVADTRGVLTQNMSEALRNRAPDQLTPYEALLRSFAYFQRVDATEHALARAALERAVEQAPSNADAWALLAILYREEYTHAFNPLPDPLGRAFAAARRAIEIAPSNHYGYHALASVLFFRQERQGFQNAAERAMTLNPMDGFTFAYMGSMFAYSGDWARGCALSQQARNLNPHHPGWYWFVPLYEAYSKRDYRTALEMGLKVNMPGFWRTHFTLAATYGQLGELESAQRAVRELLAIRPDFAATVRTELAKWHYPQLIEHLIDGLRKAGMEIAEADSPKGAASR